MKPRIFFVTREVYCRGTGELQHQLVYARDLDELAKLLGEEIDPDTWDWESDPQGPPTPWQHLRSTAGDGCDGYVISELKGPDMDRLALVPILPEPE